MPTSHYAFRLLPLEEQCVLLCREGSFLSRRWEDGQGVGLYHLEGDFFCEVYFEGRDGGDVRHTRTFTSVKCLELYADYISLSDLLT